MIDWFYPVLNWIDGGIGLWIPEFFRIILWGGLSGAGAILLYSWGSDQKGISRIKEEIKNIRKRMFNPDLEKEEYFYYIRKNLFVSLTFLRKVSLPSFMASIPVLINIFWISAFFTFQLPPSGEKVSVKLFPEKNDVVAKPSEVFLRTSDGFLWVVGDDSEPLRFLDRKGLAFSWIPHLPVSGVVYKKKWWNWFVENEVGYIREDSPIDEIRWFYPRKVIIDGVPEWMATWEFPYFATLFLTALGIKFFFRIQ